MLRTTLGLLVALTITTSSFAQGAYALKLEAGSMVVFPHHGIMNTGETATIETWVRAVEPDAGHMNSFTRYATSAEHKELAVSASRRIQWLYAGSPWDHTGHCRETEPNVYPDDGAWHHIALVRRADGTWEVYLDGTSIVVGGPGTGLWQCCWLTCGIINANTPTQLGNNGGGWLLGSVHVSTVERYSGNFIPDRSFIADSSTAMLASMDEGSGSTIFDLGPAGQQGNIEGDFEWVSIDCNGNGIPDDEDIITKESEDCNANGIPDECDIAADPALDTNGNGILDSCECLVTAYCKSEPNSVGTPALLSHSGSVSVMHNDLALQVSGCPPHEKGVFFYGGAPAALPFGDGTLCITAGSAAYFRFAPVMTDASGLAQQGIDLASPLQLAGTITHESTWFFQFWYTDTGARSSGGFNLSDALEIRFCQ
jgi:hypothetical protein